LKSLYLFRFRDCTCAHTHGAAGAGLGVEAKLGQHYERRRRASTVFVRRAGFAAARHSAGVCAQLVVAHVRERGAARNEDDSFRVEWKPIGPILTAKAVALVDSTANALFEGMGSRCKAAFVLKVKAGTE
jgi:hypothetical protein